MIKKSDNTSKTLIIRNPNVVLKKEYINARGFDVENPFVFDTTLIGRTLRRLMSKFKVPFRDIFYNKNILKYNLDTIIVFESVVTKDFLMWLKKSFPNARIIVWYWNIAHNTLNPNTLVDLGVELWSFSRKDCLRYDMKFNPPPYFREITVSESEIKFDLSFIGKNKGRLDEIIRYQEKFSMMKLNTNFIITPSNRRDKNKLYSKFIPYEEVVKINGQSKALFDLIEIDDSGQSLRVFEALFLQRKLVTNSKLIKDYDFYNSENIYVLTEDNYEGVADFITRPYIPISADIVDRYDFTSFIDRFFEESEVDQKMMLDYKERANVK